jgi:hypothetical protein
VSPDRAEGGLSIFVDAKDKKRGLQKFSEKYVLQINGTGAYLTNEVIMWRKLRNENDSMTDILLHGIDFCILRASIRQALFVLDRLKKGFGLRFEFSARAITETVNAQLWILSPTRAICTALRQQFGIVVQSHWW